MKLIILDRDGVINHESRDFIKSPAEWHELNGSIEAIANLSKAGYTIAVATNQSGVGRKLFDIDMLQNIHAKMLSKITALGGSIYKIYFCPHAPTDGCDCRKPRPGMFEQIADDLNIDLRESNAIFVGDSLRDVELGLATGCKMYLVTSEGSDGKHTLEQLTAEQRAQVTVVENLAEVARQILL